MKVMMIEEKPTSPSVVGGLVIMMFCNTSVIVIIASLKTRLFTFFSENMLVIMIEMKLICASLLRV